MDLERILRRALVAVAVAGLAAGIGAHAAQRPDVAGWCWTIATVPVIAGLAVSIVRDFLAGRVGVDAIALVSMSGALALGQPLAGAVVWSPEPPPVSKPPRTLRDAVFEPLIGIFRKSRALEIIAFLLLYKFGENLATALTRPFLIQKCFSPEDVGLATATIGLIAIIGGTFFGAWTTDRIGLGRALWIFGITQAVGFLGYIVVDRMTPGVPCAGGAAGAISQSMASRLVMYGSVGVENLCQGMANGAFGVLLLRLTQKQFSATQYALFSSVFALGRTLAGLVGPGASVTRGEEHLEIGSFKEAMKWLFDQARKGQSIQRYKGLGEMSAEQLWETTMDPARRTLLSVKLEDIAETETIFSTLMGEDVESRRKFIEDNALDVKNLDI